MPPWLRILTLHALLLALWMAGFAVARVLEYAPHASLWFPPAAVTFAALLVLGARALPTLWLACVLATLAADAIYAEGLEPAQLLSANLSFAVTHTLAYALVAWPLRRLTLGRLRAARSMRALAAFLLGGALASAVAALAGTLGLAWSGMLEPAAVALILVPWWIGDYAGLIALSPLLVVMLVPLVGWAGIDGGSRMPELLAARVRGGAAGFAAKLSLLLVYSSLVLLAASWLPEQETLIFALFVSVVIQLWIVHTESEVDALISIAAFSFLLVGATAVLGLGAQAPTLQFALICLAANSHFGLIVPRLYADNRRLRRLLTHDALTGALSRAFFEDRAREGLERARRSDTPLSLVMIDLDNLKRINDRLGHAAGDRALVALIAACSRCLRPVDAIGRLSGDEFCVLLPDVDGIFAESVVTDMRKSLAGTESGLPIAIEASFGIATLDPANASYDALLARADAAMYRDKRARGGIPP